MRLFIKQLVVVSLLLVLLGCDEKNKPVTAPENDKQTVATTTDNKSTDQAIDQPSKFSPDAALIKKYHDTPFRVIDSSEVMLDGSSTLVITFSVPLSPKQNFANLVRLVDNESGYVDGAWELSDNGLELRYRYLAPNRKLTLTVDKMLLAINDSRLKNLYQSEITTQDRQPMVGFASKGFLLPKKSMSGLPVVTLNVDKVDVNFFKIKPEKLTDFMADFGMMNQVQTWNAKTLSRYMDLIYSSRFDLNPRRNAQETVLINLASIQVLQQEGVYIAVMNQAGSYNYSNPATLFSISNIGVAAHLYEKDKLSILTHALDNGAVLPNVQLSLFCNKAIRDSNSVSDNSINNNSVNNSSSNNSSSNNNSNKQKQCKTITVKTDKQGYAVVNLTKASDYALLTATDGQQTSFVNLDRNALNLSEFNLTGSRYYAKQLFAFGPRDLYRPNETVYLNALLRDADGRLLPDQPIKVDVISPDGQSVKDFVWQPANNQKIVNQHGFYQTKYTIPNDAATGKWAFRFNLGDDDYRYYKFSVEEFLPERMAMEINVPSKNPILMDDSIDFNIKGWYLYGAPASDNTIQGNVYLKKVDELPELEGYKIGAVTDTGINHQLDEVDQQLDSNGVTQVSVDSRDWRDIRSPVNVILQTSLLDDGGRPVTRTASQIVWPAAQMPAIRALFSESPYYDWSSDRYENRPTIDRGNVAEFEVAYINNEGQKLATNALKARIVRERHDSYWTWSDDDGWESRQNLKEFTLSEEKLSIPDKGTAKVSYLPDDYGSYRIEIVDTKNNIISSIRFWCGYDWEDNTGGTTAVRPDQVKLSLDKSYYKAGDTAKVHVEAPVAGAGYIALETNDGMLWKQDITVSDTGLDVEIPIENWQRHDIYISTMIIRPSTNAEVQTIKRAIGLLYLPLDTTDRQLAITLDAPKKTEPEKTVAIKVKLDPKALKKDHKVTALVSAVDAGVLNITNFVTPDPYSAFLGRKRYDVDLYDVYGRLIEGSGRQVKMSFGGDGMDVSGGKKPLTVANIVAQQLKTIELDDKGEGVVELALPDFNGELRLMAQVWDDDRFGKAEQSMIVAAPIVAELSTPRFLAGGDHAMLALELNNLSGKRQNIQLAITASGLVSQDKINTSMLTLANNQRQIIQIPVVAGYGYGQGNIDLTIKGVTLEDGSDYRLSRSWQIGVRPAYAATVKNYAVALKGGEKWTLPAAATIDLIDNTISSKLIVSNQPPLNIAQYITTLFAYPYGCLEQTISGLYPSLYANQEQLAALGIKTDSDEKRREKVQLGIDRILSMQRDNGSFGLWTRESNEEYWLTVYATDFLLQAKERGYQVNNSALEQAMKRIGEYIYDNSAFYNMQSYYDSEVNDYSQFATKAYAAMILVKQNKITPAIRNEINRMYQQVTANSKVVKSPLPLVQLALAAKLAGFENLFDNLMSMLPTIHRDDQYYWLGDYGSTVRDQALVLALLIENDVDVDKQSSYLFGLSDLLNDKRYFSTQELNALFIAGWLIDQHRAAQQFVTELNGNTIKTDKALVRTFTSPQGLTIANPLGNSPLYMKFSLSGYAKKAPAPTANNNILTIKRSYYNNKGKEIKPDQLKVGDLVLVLLDVNSRKMINDALIIDFLPAGLELENQNLMNSSINLLEIPGLANLLQNEDNSDVKYQEYRDDRYVAAVAISDYYHKRVAYLARAVTAGDYTIPYPYVESMYHPEWFAIGKSPDMMSITERKK
ncbi:alpha-2-macroglobulin [Orbaceae bacterium ESL0727]|nr:alpha-2-macroglobulin [Orbaceae bacterium ESL0727]